ncbi:uncharacterized protein LOC124313488 isoform X1 [Daphnia pulicaria]|uniref:uncharacterized protein LOC124313485 isoform X1 n=1 Tax=Daphnia pulicaria TaxID=35523 RepID=UPI001EEB5852|nr:uncharacterized protein LOC124313485 isoform X1 [Daphnia pulicaria]XP_046634395.1 uncharacterized protein LOC124313486 isoform X1 [Daphnia pulicaria]XP_046634397.1 uncharacterized protein LOC124313487 isoform X1 [Daphnia pulicaria]XP_046634400.1 uncharacterized protein LOC124313488 isoform X1 [Daphnia pulicaria]
MRFQVQILLVAAVCAAALFNGACSAPTTSDALLEPTSLDLERATAVDDNGENDENPILIFLAKLLIKQIGCAAAKAKADSCGRRELSVIPSVPLVPLVPLDRSPEDDEFDQVSFSCRLAKFIRRFC